MVLLDRVMCENEDVLTKRDFNTSIQCGNELWQRIVLTGVILDVCQNNVVYGNCGVGHDNWDLIDSLSKEYTSDGSTTHYHGVKITHIWGYMSNMLSLFGIDFESGDSDWGDDTLDGCQLYMQTTVREYLTYLCEKGFLINTGSRMGHDDELNYVLGERLRKYLLNFLN